MEMRRRLDEIKNLIMLEPLYAQNREHMYKKPG